MRLSWKDNQSWNNVSLKKNLKIFKMKTKNKGVENYVFSTCHITQYNTSKVTKNYQK